MTEEDFRANTVVQSAVLYKIIIIGEATKRLSSSFRSEHPEIPWDDMAGARDRLIHGYDKVRTELVWAIVHDHLPPLISSIATLAPWKKP